MDGYRLAEIERRLNNLMRLGTIQAVNAASARVRVTIGAALTYWLPWLTTRAGDDRTWWAPSVGEQVLVLSPSGDLNNAMVLPAVYQDAHAAPDSDPNVHLVEYSDGATVKYDKGAHKMTITVPGDVEISATGDVIVDSGGDINATAGGDISAEAGGAATMQAATAITLTAPTITLNGVTVVNGPLSQGAGGAGGNATLSGTLTVTGGITTPADVVANGTSLHSHTHGETGSETLPPT